MKSSTLAPINDNSLTKIKLGLTMCAALALFNAPAALATSGLDLQTVITGSVYNCDVISTTNTITPYINTSGNIAANGYIDSVPFTFIGDVTLNFSECDYTLTFDGQTGDSTLITSATIANPVVTSLTHSSSINLEFDETNINNQAIGAILNSSFVWNLVGTNK
ncbi:hypothetical protein EOL70_02590 [Leucothrix sargassi]|nr:hypothetical protein EOL70_02590 [Leucothrix sargassi]